jgi:hypothetical protein
MDSSLQPGDPVIWWKRVPGGPYVVPLAATVLAVTAHRVKIRADDDGRPVIRYVPPASLQPRDPLNNMEPNRPRP